MTFFFYASLCSTDNPSDNKRKKFLLCGPLPRSVLKTHKDNTYSTNV